MHNNYDEDQKINIIMLVISDSYVHVVIFTII